MHLLWLFSLYPSLCSFIYYWCKWRSKFKGKKSLHIQFCHRGTPSDTAAMTVAFFRCERHRFFEWLNILFKTAVCICKLPFWCIFKNNLSLWLLVDVNIAVQHKVHASEYGKHIPEFCFHGSLRQQEELKSHSHFYSPDFSTSSFFIFFLCSVCAHIWVCCGASDGRLFASNHSFHCLYHPSTETQRRDKMDSPPRSVCLFNAFFSAAAPSDWSNSTVSAVSHAALLRSAPFRYFITILLLFYYVCCIMS